MSCGRGVLASQVGRRQRQESTLSVAQAPCNQGRRAKFPVAFSSRRSDVASFRGHRAHDSSDPLNPLAMARNAFALFVPRNECAHTRSPSRKIASRGASARHMSRGSHQALQALASASAQHLLWLTRGKRGTHVGMPRASVASPWASAPRDAPPAPTLRPRPPPPPLPTLGKPSSQVAPSRLVPQPWRSAAPSPTSSLPIPRNHSSLAPSLRAAPAPLHLAAQPAAVVGGTKPTHPHTGACGRGGRLARARQIARINAPLFTPSGSCP